MIRRLTPADAPILRDLRLLALTDSPDAFGSTLEKTIQRSLADWEAMLRSEGNPYFVFESGSPHRGLIGVLRSNESRTAHLVSMWVAPPLRGRGVSDDLVRHVIAWANDSGSHRLELSCTEGNKYAENLYIRHGFVRTGEAETRERDGMTEFDMTLPLKRASGR
jgi:ribosomal protein S18 acetylase RimI-like enzyme